MYTFADEITADMTKKKAKWKKIAYCYIMLSHPFIRMSIKW